MDERATARVRLQLAARGAEALWPLLGRLRGHRVGAWTLEEPIHAGRHALLFAARNAQTAAPAVVKMAALPYHAPAAFSIEDIRCARERIGGEADRLCAAGLPDFPVVLALETAPNPLHVPRGDPEIAASEPFLVLERVEGTCLAAWRSANGADPGAIARLAESALRQGLDLIERLDRVGWVYTDWSPRNLMMEAPSGRLRVVDGGGLARAGKALAAPEVTPEYLRPADHAALAAGGSWTPSRDASAGSLARVVAEVVANRIPQAGAPLDEAFWAGVACPDALREHINEALRDAAEPNAWPPKPSAPPPNA